MKSCLLCVSLFLLVLMATSGTLGCDTQTGPVGVTECYIEPPYYSKYRCGTCVTNAYVIQKSNGKFRCRNTAATYCYYQCMLERYELDRGPVYDDCLCEANVSLPQQSVILSPSCYSPNGTDCSWYRQCLVKMYNCSGQADYAIQYGEKYCNILTELRLAVSAQALQWINAVRKCLQVSLAHLIRPCREQLTCQTVLITAINSHIPCYLTPYQGFSLCLLPVSDWLRIFGRLKALMALRHSCKP